MNDFVDFFSKLTDVKDFPARWYCGRWSDFHGWLYILSDFFIGLAYFVIPALIIRFVTQKRNGVAFHWLYILFAAFICFCGLTHFVESAIFWFPIYRISALLKLATAIISWITIIYVVKIIPLAFSLKSPEELEKEIALRKKIEENLILKNAQLQESKEIAKLGTWQWHGEIIEWSALACKLFGLSSNLDINRHAFLQHIHADDRDFVESVLVNIFSTKTFPEFYCRIIANDNAVKHVLMRGTLKFDETGRIVQMNGTIQDITDERKAMDQIKLQNEKLREIAWIHAHNVRSPLSSVLGLTDILLKENLTEDQKEIVNMLHKAANNLDATISDITQKAHVLNIG